MVESGLVPRKGRIRASTEKLSARVWEEGTISWSTEKLSGRVSEEGTISLRTEKWYNPGDYREKVDSVRVSKNCPDECLNKVESV